MASTKLLGIYSNGIVFQRNKPIVIEGEESDKSEVKITFAGNDTVVPVSDGKFKASLPPSDVIINTTLTVEGSETITLKDVCVGDVYMLAGQSNMELPVKRTIDYNKEEIEANDYPLIRQYLLTPDYGLPLKGERSGCKLPAVDWTSAVGDNKYAFGAIGFYSAKRIFEKTGVPIGIILNAQGGATIEAWMSEEDLSEAGIKEEEIAPFRGEGVIKAYLAEGEKECNEWRGETVDPAFSLDSALEKAVSVELPGIVVKDYSGSVWFVKEFYLEKQAEGTCLLRLGDLIDADVTCVNGVEVGRTEYQYPPRKYSFDGSLLKVGKNVVSVRIIIEHEFGGFVPGHPYFLKTDSEVIDMTGEWKMVYEKKMPEFIPHKMAQFIPATCYYASILTIKDFAISQMWWCQGESNAGEPEGYDQKMVLMFKRIRSFFGDVPVVLVKIADYINPLTFETEVPEGWRKIQELQDKAPEYIDKIKVVTSPTPDPIYELHPQNKSGIGEGVAEASLSF